VEFHGYVNASNWPYWSITPVTNDPVTASASILNTDIKAEAISGYYLHREETGTLTTGYIVHMLGGNVNTNLQASLVQNWFAIGIVDTDPGTYYIGFDGWNEANKPFLVINYTPLPPPQNWLTIDGGSSVTGSIPGQDSQTIQMGFDASGLTEGIYIANIIISSNDPDSPNTSIPVTLNVVPHIFADLKVFLEGPFNGSLMDTDLTSMNSFPMTQPYQSPPWNYPGAENVSIIPQNVVDWLLVDYRDAADAASATSATSIKRQAAFLLKDGSIVGMDGISNLQPDISVSQHLFVVINHRNHLSVMSANPITMLAGVYQYDFSDGENKAYGGLAGHKMLASGVWGMRSGDGNSDGETNITDKNIWSYQVVHDGYSGSDFNLDLQINNIDKNDFWLPNSGMGSQVPE